jgi:nicotinamide phosphoribosyltransferase
MSSLESAQLSGAAHLLSFKGTDTLPALSWIGQYYPGENGFLGGSVPATEHSVMCAGIAEMGEQDTFERLMDIYPSGIVSIVSDTEDFFAVLTKILPALKDKIMARDGKLVIRPDSGDPADIICGKASRSLTTERHLRDALRTNPSLVDEYPEDFGAVELLWNLFGGTVNDKGFKELDPHIGLIYGDSITLERAGDIATRLARKGFASTNVVFGVGSFTYQYNTRDTFGSAIKATQVVVYGEPRNIQKNPKTDSGLKKSATGRLAVLHKMDGIPYLIENASKVQEEASLLQPVWENGRFLKQYSFADVRANLARTAAIREHAGA